MSNHPIWISSAYHKKIKVFAAKKQTSMKSLTEQWIDAGCPIIQHGQNTVIE